MDADQWVQVCVVVPAAAAARMRALAIASGVTFDGFIAASLELRTREHEGRDRLLQHLAEAARGVDAARPRAALER